MADIRRDFLPAHLQEEITSCGIDGVVSVQARQTIEETRFLLDFPSQHSFIRGVVGWVPLVAFNVADVLGSFVATGALKGVRHVLQAEIDDQYMLREDFNRGIRALAEFGLAYDILILERQLPQTIKLVDRHPDQVFVLDHIAKPRIRDHVLSPWRENVAILAERPNVYCKLSGMITEADPQRWSYRDLAPYFDSVLEAFRPDRLMFGSDWPVCLTGTSYCSWFDLVYRRLESLSMAERNAILGQTAVRAYGLSTV